MSEPERQEALAELCSDRFADRSPSEVFHTLLDEGRYICSERTMYRILAGEDAVKERRDQLRHPKHARPELMATRVNEVWSWDITKLLTTEKWSYLYLYVLLDLYSRFVVGWMIARHENSTHATRLIRETVRHHDVTPGSLVLHSDRGSPMTSKTTAQLLADLDVTRSLNRPHVSNDNPYSESLFKTAKYHPSFPGRFAAEDDATAWGRPFFDWYNNGHHHSGIAYLTPADVFYGRADDVLDQRHRVLVEAYHTNPERFPHGPPERRNVPPAAYHQPANEKCSSTL